MLDRSLLFNLGEVVVGAREGSPWYDPQKAFRRAERQIGRLRIRAPSPLSPANALSGGNQQKVVIGKWLEIAPNVMLLDDPTRGIDVGAKREIYALIREMSAEGRIVLFSSTELPELIGLCDRIVVLYRGRVAGELAGDDVSEHALLHLINTGELPPELCTATAVTEVFSRRSRGRSRLLRLPDELGVIVALDGDDRRHRRGPAALSQSDQPAHHSGQYDVPGHAVAGHGVSAGDPRNRSVGRLDVQFLRRHRRTAHGRRPESVARDFGRRGFWRRAWSGECAAGGRAAVAHDHRHAGHVFDVRGPVAGGEQRPRGGACRTSPAAILP